MLAFGIIKTALLLTFYISAFLALSFIVNLITGVGGFVAIGFGLFYLAVMLITDAGGLIRGTWEQANGDYDGRCFAVEIAAGGEPIVTLYRGLSPRKASTYVKFLSDRSVAVSHRERAGNA